MGERSEKMLSLEYYRKLIRTYIERQHYSSALFWADKVVMFSNGDARDLYWQAQAMALSGQNHRAVHLIKLHKLDKESLHCRYLAAKCMYQAKDYGEALDMLDIPEELVNSRHKTEAYFSEVDQETGELTSNIMSSLLYLKGQVYEAMCNRSLAAEFYREALKYDVHCYEAFEALIQHQMLTIQEEKDLLKSLPFRKQCSHSQPELVQFLYEDKLKKYGKPSRSFIPPQFHPMKYNHDFLVNQAERHYYNCEYEECNKITEEVLKKDPFHSACLPLHVGCLVERRNSNALFQLAHKLVDLYPGSAFAWFAVGCYYYLTGKNDPARIYLSKATTIDKVFGPAWLAYGHSFAIENEHDQAMAAYFKASQLMKGCHLPLLYIGLECGLTNNPKLAEKFFQQALEIAPEDPFVLHEMGVIAYQNQAYATAERYFLEAFSYLRGARKNRMTEKWEPILNNLGHVCRKLQKYDEALEYHQQALVLVPLCATTYSAIGFVNALMGNVATAVDAFHKALGLKRDDTFSTTMLSSVIEQLMEELPPFEGALDFHYELPDKPLKSSSTSLNSTKGSTSTAQMSSSRTAGVVNAHGNTSSEERSNKGKTGKKRNVLKVSALEKAVKTESPESSAEIEMDDQISGLEAEVESSKSDD